MSNYNKVSIVVLIIVFSLGFSMYEKNKLDNYFEKSSEPLLKSLPEISGLKVFGEEENFNFKNVASASNGLIVHYWGTWCAPCEYELPSFMKLVRKFEEFGVTVILLAVKDDDIKIKKFMKRFGSLPKNVKIVHDNSGSTMPKFGVVKVPETFLFSSAGKTLLKFSGPQDWEKDYYFKRVINNLQMSL